MLCSAGEHLLFPLPEMTFADNHLELTHHPSGFKYTFAALESLAEVRVGAGWEEGGGGVKVKYAEEWGKTRSALGHVSSTPDRAPAARLARSVSVQQDDRPFPFGSAHAATSDSDQAV